MEANYDNPEQVESGALEKIRAFKKFALLALDFSRSYLNVKKRERRARKLLKGQPFVPLIVLDDKTLLMGRFTKRNWFIRVFRLSRRAELRIDLQIFTPSRNGHWMMTWIDVQPEKFRTLTMRVLSRSAFDPLSLSPEGEFEHSEALTKRQLINVLKTPSLKSFEAVIHRAYWPQPFINLT